MKAILHIKSYVLAIILFALLSSIGCTPYYANIVKKAPKGKTLTSRRNVMKKAKYNAKRFEMDRMNKRPLTVIK